MAFIESLNVSKDCHHLQAEAKATRQSL